DAAAVGGALQGARLDPYEPESVVGNHHPQRERAARQALAIGAVACVNRLWCFGDLVADRAALAPAGLRKFHLSLPADAVSPQNCAIIALTARDSSGAKRCRVRPPNPSSSA